MYVAGWLGEAGLTLSKYPPFAPGGSNFTQIVNSDYFGLDDLYVAFILDKDSKRYKFGWGAEVQQQR